MRLSVLDQAPITKGNSSADALKKAEELAILAEDLGYHRMWMAEHHGTGSMQVQPLRFLLLTCRRKQRECELEQVES